jgi:hypothetical protein
MRAVLPLMVSLVALTSPSPQAIEKRTLGFSYNDDRTSVIATFSSDPPIAMSMNAAVVEQVIQNLATLRADMVPPRPIVDHPLKNLEYAKFGRWQLLTLESGAVVLMILHPGYGYVGVQLDRDSMRSLKQNLEKLSSTQPQDETSH